MVLILHFAQNKTQIKYELFFWANIKHKVDSNSIFTTTITDAVEITNTGGTSLKYDGSSGQFHANWKTPKSPNTCWEVKTTTTNGPSISAYFKLK